MTKLEQVLLVLCLRVEMIQSVTTHLTVLESIGFQSTKTIHTYTVHNDTIIGNVVAKTELNAPDIN